jgi:hypothetical protein
MKRSDWIAAVTVLLAVLAFALVLGSLDCGASVRTSIDKCA